MDRSGTASDLRGICIKGSKKEAGWYDVVKFITACSMAFRVFWVVLFGKAVVSKIEKPEKEKIREKFIRQMSTFGNYEAKIQKEILFQRHRLN